MQQALVVYHDLKHTQYVGKEKLLCQHLAEQICENHIFGLSLDRIDHDTYHSLEQLCKSFFSRPELLYHNHKLAPFALETIRELRENFGLKIVACSNSNAPLRHKIVMEQFGGAKIEELFDDFVVSADLQGVRMPNPEFV